MALSTSKNLLIGYLYRTIANSALQTQVYHLAEPETVLCKGWYNLIITTRGNDKGNDLEPASGWFGRGSIG